MSNKHDVRKKNKRSEFTFKQNVMIYQTVEDFRYRCGPVWVGTKKPSPAQIPLDKAMHQMRSTGEP